MDGQKIRICTALGLGVGFGALFAAPVMLKLAARGAGSGAPLEDRVSATQASALIVEKVPEDRPGPEPVFSARMQPTEAELDRLPLAVLRKAFERRMERLDAGVEARFEERRPATEGEEQALKAEVYETLAPLLSTGKGYFEAKTSITVGGKSVPLQLELTLYDRTARTTVLDALAGPPTDPKDLCYVIAARFFDERSERAQAVTSNCLAGVRKLDGKRVITQVLNVNGVDEEYSHLLVELPSVGGGSALLELMEASSGKWKRQPEVSWRQFSAEEYDEMKRAATP